MDTGALAGNFVLRQVVVDLCLTSDVITSLVPVTVCRGLDNHCIDIYDSITLKLSDFCSILNNYASFEIQALILENSQLKVIVGVHTIRAYNLFHLLPKQMVLKAIPILSAMTCSCCTSASQQVCMPCGCQPDGDFATSIHSLPCPDISYTDTHTVYFVFVRLSVLCRWMSISFLSSFSSFIIFTSCICNLSTKSTHDTVRVINIITA